MLHDFNLEFADPSPGPAALEPRIRAQIGSERRAWLVTDDAEPFGLAQVLLHDSIWTERPIACLEELYVKPGRRGSGAGRDLLEAVLALARERGAAWAWVATGEDDLAARGLYESCGFANEIEGPEKARALYYELELDRP